MRSTFLTSTDYGKVTGKAPLCTFTSAANMRTCIPGVMGGRSANMPHMKPDDNKKHLYYSRLLTLFPTTRSLHRRKRPFELSMSSLASRLTLHFEFTDSCTPRIFHGSRCAKSVVSSAPCTHQKSVLLTNLATTMACLLALWVPICSSIDVSTSFAPSLCSWRRPALLTIDPLSRSMRHVLA